jgi:signal transduction histidine kinase
MKMHEQTVLIVDDEEKNIRLLKAILGVEGYSIQQAFNGKQALELVKEAPPDLILLDVMMPEMDGFELCGILKQNKATRFIPVVMVTSLRGSENLVKAKEAGADDFLNKPVDKTELLVRVKSMLRMKSYSDELVTAYKEIALKNRKLKELEAAKNSFMHMIVHDLKTPLTAVSLSLELLLTGIAQLTEDHTSILEKCIDYCADIDNSLKTILDLEKMEEGKLNLSKSVVNPWAVVDEVLAQFSVKIGMKKIETYFPSPLNETRATFDPEIIKRVVGNLISNAVRHTPEQGRIELNIEVSERDSTFNFSIRDNGNGVDPAHHQKIFEKFQQAEEGNNADSGTSGLGLAFCKVAIERHGGRIWVESDGDGNGSIFKFTIPA